TATASDEGHTDYEVSFESCHSWNNSYTYPDMGYSSTDAGGPECTTTAWTTHEDWPSQVDATLAMMETEADLAAAVQGVISIISDPAGDERRACNYAVSSLQSRNSMFRGLK
ncbi:MAG: hypothetical protein ABI614_07295, partial [Planctomycetota bacterium]